MPHMNLSCRLLPSGQASGFGQVKNKMGGHLRLMAVCFSIALTAVLPAGATIVPSLDLPALAADSDLIAVGRVSAVHQKGWTTVHLTGGASVPARSMFAQLDVEKALKGQLDGRTIRFVFSFPDVPIGYAGIRPEQFGVFFLRKSENGYAIVDPYHPFVGAVRGTPGVQGSLLDQITAEVARVLTSPETSAESRWEAVRALETAQTPLTTDALKTAARDNALLPRVWAMAALLERNDTSVLATAADLLLSPNQDRNLLGHLAYAVERVKDPKAVPILTRLLRSTDVNVRRGAAAALRNTLDKGAIGPLTKALSDSDPQVRYSGVIGLAEITGQMNEWAPAYETFLKDQQRYLTYWNNWARSRN